MNVVMEQTKPFIAIVGADFYPKILQDLTQGAVAFLEEKNYPYECITVPGALEVPSAIAMLIDKSPRVYGGFLALGCVIRGETSHYDIVAQLSARALMDLSLTHKVPIGNGILTVNTMTQAENRAGVTKGNKGRFTARACLSLLELGATTRAPAK